MARLIVKTDGGTDTVELSPGQPISVGRDAANQVALADVPGVSRMHCRITAVKSGDGLAWEVSDLGATNKTRVNGKAADKRMLSSGDVIGVGKAEITFEDPQEEERLKAAGAKGVCLLEWVSGDRRGEKVMLDAPRTTIGRRPSNTIPLDDRMSSGHHAEISKDLNGYTIRDLGSTNGTLVNGEPLTEAALTHGSRVRIGNSRFVFKDPSMKDIEVELSQFDEDEGWGMMGDIDLSRARGSYVGLLLGVLLLGAAAAGGWFLMQQAESETSGGDVTADANLVQNGNMEDTDAIQFLWNAQGGDAFVSIGSTKRGKGNALLVKHTGGEESSAPVVVGYADEFPALASQPLRVRASVSASGDAALVAVWRNKADAASGATGLTHTISLGKGTVNHVVAKPPWADLVSIGVRVGPGGRAVVDDLRVTRESGGGVACKEFDCPGDPKAWLHPSGTVDVVNSLTVLVCGAQPVARTADGAVLSEFEPDGDAEVSAGGVTVKGTLRDGDAEAAATVTWGQSESGDGLEAKVEVEGAQAVGLDAKLLRAHVGDGMNIVTSEGPRGITAAAGHGSDKVEKTLGGEPRSTGGRPPTLVTFAPQADASANTLELLDAADASALLVRHWTTGASASFVLVTDYEVQSRAAQAALDAAEREVREYPARGIKRLREVKVLYPFNERVSSRAIQVAEESERKAREEIDAYEEALQAFLIFRSTDTLAALDKQSAALVARYPAGSGALESRVAEITAQAEEARAAYYAGAELSRLEKLADLLAGDEGYRPMAAILYRTIVERFGHLEGPDSFGRRVTRARSEYEKLMKVESVAQAVPTPGGSDRDGN